MRFRFAEHLLAFTFAVCAPLSIYLSESTSDRIRQIRADQQIAMIQTTLEEYSRREGNLPLRLSDIPDLPADALIDPWGRPLHYDRLGADPGRQVVSPANDAGRRRGRLRHKARHRLILLASISLGGVLTLRCFGSASELKKNAPLLISFLVGTFAHLGDCGIVPLPQSILWFYGMLGAAMVLSIAAAVSSVRRRTPTCIGEIANTPYAIFSVLQLVA